MLGNTQTRRGTQLDNPNLLLAKIFVMVLLPLFMIDAKTLLSVHVPTDGLADQRGVGILLAPCLELGVALGGIDLHVLVACESMDASSGHEGDGATHDDDDGIGGGIAEPGLLGTVLWQWLQKIRTAMTDRRKRTPLDIYL